MMRMLISCVIYHNQSIVHCPNKCISCVMFHNISQSEAWILMQNSKTSICTMTFSGLTLDWPDCPGQQEFAWKLTVTSLRGNWNGQNIFWIPKREQIKTGKLHNFSAIFLLWFQFHGKGYLLSNVGKKQEFNGLARSNINNAVLCITL